MNRILPLCAFALLFTDAALAQVYYGGYNLGPDYGAMIQQAQQQQAALNQQMRQQEQAIVAQAMQSPDCQAKYRAHLAQGGTLPYPQFAYQYAATGGFTPDGIARFRQGEAANQRGEAAAYAGLRQAEAASAAALANDAEHAAARQRDFGENLSGNAGWIDPHDGARKSLGYLGDNASYVDPNSGRAYQRDASGQYYAQGADGLWYAMTPAR